MKIRVDSIVPNPEQPRLEFDQDELESLAQSIEEDGLQYPIKVEEVGNHYILIDGERRWRAHHLLGRVEIEAYIEPSKNGSGSKDRLVRALITNMQRAELNSIEQARAFQKLQNLGYQIDEIASKAGLSISAVCMRLGLLKLDEPIQQLYMRQALPLHGQVTAALLSLPDAEMRVKMAGTFAKNRTPIRLILSICTRMARAKGPYAKQQIHSKEAQQLKAKGGHWSMIQQADLIEMPAFYQKAAEDTCGHCALYDGACPGICKDCPAVELLKRISNNIQEMVAK